MSSKGIDIEQFAKNQNVAIVAPAGCGKTHLIAEAVKLSTGRQLILTHTHAGVKSILNKLKKLSVPAGKYRVETIAGFALRYASSYPKLGGKSLFDAFEMILYENLYDSAVNVLQTEIAKKIIQTSFQGLYVDEYQDCTLAQHKLIVYLSEYIPTHVLGDPLQGIFENTGELVNWDQHVFTNFELTNKLSFPWRWQQANPFLGKWLFSVREFLEADQPIPLRDLPRNTKYIKKDRMAQINQLKWTKGNCVGIIDFESRAHDIAKNLQGTFNSMEEIERRTLSKFCRLFQGNSRRVQLAALLDIVYKCMTKVKGELTFIYQFLQSENSQFRSSKHIKLYELIQDYINNGKLSSLNEFLNYIDNVQEKSVYRKELWTDLKRLIKNHEMQPSIPLIRLLTNITTQNSHMGRVEYQRAISRPMLIKGLEFENAILLDADCFSTKQLYVALTRGRNSLVILADKPELVSRFK